MKKTFLATVAKAILILMAGFAVAIAIGALARQAAAQELYYIDSCIDGDTCTGQANGADFTLQLAYVDAPELDQPLGQYALWQLRSHVQGQIIEFQQVDYDPIVNVYWGIMRLNGQDVAEHVLGLGAAYIVYDGLPQNLMINYEPVMRSAAESNHGVWAGGPYLLPAIHRDRGNMRHGQQLCTTGLDLEDQCQAFPNFNAAQIALFCGNNMIDPDGDGVACN